MNHVLGVVSLYGAVCAAACCSSSLFLARLDGIVLYLPGTKYQVADGDGAGEKKVHYPRKKAFEHRASRYDLPQKRGTGHGLWFCERVGVPEKM